MLLLALSGGAWFFFFSGSSKPADTIKPRTTAAIPLVPPQVAFYDMPDVVVNIQTADGTAAYLKLGVSLELVSAEERAGLQVLKPRGSSISSRLICASCGWTTSKAAPACSA